MTETKVFEKKVSDKNITEITASIDNKVTPVDSTIESGMELLISLEPYGYKFSNLRIISYRKGSNITEVAAQVAGDLTELKNAFLDKVEELMN